MTEPLPNIPFTTLHANLKAHLGLVWDAMTTEQLFEWVETHAKIIDGHGTRTRYQSDRGRCRCPLCVQAQKVFAEKKAIKQYKRDWGAYHRERKRKRLQMLADLEEDDEL